MIWIHITIGYESYPYKLNNFLLMKEVIVELNP